MEQGCENMGDSVEGKASLIRGPALVSLETEQGVLEQATGRILRLRIEGPVPRVIAEYG